MIRTGKLPSWAVLSDIQIPYQDRRVLAGVVDFIKWLKPYGIILNGDIVDMEPFSTFDKDPRAHRIQKEIDEAIKLMQDLRESGAKELYWLGGNHEDRLRRYIWRCAAALPVDAVDFPTMFKIAENGFVWKPYGRKVRLGKLIVTHGDIVRAHSAYSAKAMFEKYGSSVLFGHTHRKGAYWRTDDNGDHISCESGCLCKRDMSYTLDPNWQQGFSVVHVGAGGLFNIQMITILRGKSLFFGAERFDF